MEKINSNTKLNKDVTTLALPTTSYLSLLHWPRMNQVKLMC